MYITDFFVRSNAVNPLPPSRPSCPSGVQRDVPLSPHTTLGVGGAAEYFATPTSLPELQQLLAWARARRLPVTLLGEGSNVIVHDGGLRGLVVRFFDASADIGQRLRIGHGSGPDGTCEVTLPGHLPWSAAVLHLACAGLFGVEALYGIPGSVGAAPVQNIGAYGQDVAQTLRAIDVVDVATSAVQRLPASALGLGYRQSHLRGRFAGRYLVTAVHLTLPRWRRRPLTYPALLQALAARGLDAAQAAPEAVAQTVWDVRAGRGMVWRPELSPRQPGTVGSFFTNPVVPQAVAEAVIAKHPSAPHWPVPAAAGPMVKLSAAWLIEAAGFARGWQCAATRNTVGLSPLHALALVNLGGATALDIMAAATLIADQVRARLGVTLTAEPVTLGFAPAS